MYIYLFAFVFFKGDKKKVGSLIVILLASPDPFTGVNYGLKYNNKKNVSRAHTSKPKNHFARWKKSKQEKDIGAFLASSALEAQPQMDF